MKTKECMKVVWSTSSLQLRDGFFYDANNNGVDNNDYDIVKKYY